MVKNISPTIVEIELIQKFYDDGNSLRDCQKKFDWSRMTLLKYIKTRSPKNISEEEKKKRAVNRVISWRQRTKLRLVKYKGGKCKKCGYKKCIRSLIFHHIDPSKKDFTVTGKTISFERLKKEVDKCDLLCANCHGEVHEELDNLNSSLAQLVVRQTVNLRDVGSSPTGGAI